MRGAEIRAKTAEGDLLHKGRKRKRSALNPKVLLKACWVEFSPSLDLAFYTLGKSFIEMPGLESQLCIIMGLVKSH